MVETFCHINCLTLHVQNSLKASKYYHKSWNMLTKETEQWTMQPCPSLLCAYSWYTILTWHGIKCTKFKKHWHEEKGVSVLVNTIAWMNDNKQRNDELFTRKNWGVSSAGCWHALAWARGDCNLTELSNCYHGVTVILLCLTTIMHCHSSSLATGQSRENERSMWTNKSIWLAVYTTYCGLRATGLFRTPGSCVFLNICLVSNYSGRADCWWLGLVMSWSSCYFYCSGSCCLRFEVEVYPELGFSVKIHFLDIAEYCSNTHIPHWRCILRLAGLHSMKKGNSC